MNCIVYAHAAVLATFLYHHLSIAQTFVKIDQAAVIHARASFFAYDRHSTAGKQAASEDACFLQPSKLCLSVP